MATMTPDLSEIGEAEWAAARRLLPVIKRLTETASLTRAEVVAAAGELGCSTSHTYVLIKRYRAMPTLTSMLPRRGGFRSGTSRFDPGTEAVIAEVIDSFYLTARKPRISDVLIEVQRRCRNLGLGAPGRKAITSRLRQHSPREILTRREGTKRARDRHAPAVGSLDAPWPLSLVQIDHTLVDVIVVDSETRRPLQRPWLTLAIDVHSRCIAGFHLALEPPSATSVALCIAQAALPKVHWLAARGIEAEWPVQGIPERLHLDNAKEFRCDALKRGCEQYGIGIDHRPVRTPHYGGHIERLIGTMMGKAHLLPGTTFSDIRMKGDLDPAKSAAMTLSEVERWLGHAVAAYHHSLHRGIGTTPLARWALGIDGDDTVLGRGEPIAVTDPRRFLIDFLPIERRLVRREGVHLFGIAYWSDVCATWVGDPEKMIVRYDPRDLSRVYLLGPDGTYYDLAYRDLRRPPITLWEHRLAAKRLHEAGLARVNEAALFDAVDAMREIADQAVRDSKLARRQRERRPRLPGSTKRSRVPEAVNDDWTDATGLQPHERMLPVEEWS
jgi:putative transposase